MLCTVDMMLESSESGIINANLGQNMVSVLTPAGWISRSHA